MASGAHNQDPSTETIIHKTSSLAEPNEHLETVLEHYEAEKVKESIEGDNIDKLPSVGKASNEKLLSSSSQPNTVVDIYDNSRGSESYGEETEEPLSKSLAVKETEGQLPKSSDGKETEGHLIEKGELNSSKEIQIMTEETVGEGYQSHNGGTYQEAEVDGSELREDNKVEKLSNASITLDNTEKIASMESVTFEDHTSRIPPQEGSFHTVSSEKAEKELHMVSSSEDLHSNLEEIESRGDMKEETTNNEKICSNADVSVTLKSDNLSELNKEEAEKGEEMNACPGTVLAVAPIDETCETGSRSEVASSSDTNEIVSLVGQSETEEKERNTEISLSEAPKEARKDETNDTSSTKEKQPIDEKNVSAVDLKEEDEMYLYATGQQDTPPLVHETEASEGTQLAVEEPKVMHNTDEEDRKLDSSDLGMPLTEGAPDLDLAPPCQINASNLETESKLIADDLNKEDEIHLNYTAKGQQDAPPLVREAEVSEGTQLSVEDPNVMHKMDKLDQKLESSDLGMSLTEGASGIDLAPPCQRDADNLETESSLIKNDLNEEAKSHPNDTPNGQQDSPSLVHEIEVSEGTQLSVEEPKVTHNTDETDRKLDSSDIQRPLPEGASDMDLAPPCQIDANNLETESRLIENDLNKEDKTHLNEMGKGQHDTPPIVHQTEGSEGTQLSVEEPKVIHHINEADKNLDSNVLELSPTEGVPDTDLAQPCQTDADNLDTGLNMDSRKESIIMETNIELEQVADSLVESHNLTTANDADNKVIKEEIELDSSNTALSDEKSDELKVQQSEPSKAPQNEATDQRDGKQSVMNDNINQNSKPQEHGETDTIKTEAEEINAPITDEEHTTLSYSTILTTEESKETNDKAATGCDGTDFTSPKEDNIKIANNKLQVNENTSIAEPDEHPESVLKLYEAENIKASNTESTDSGNIDEFPSVDEVQSAKLLSSSSELSQASETESGKEQISESLEGKEIQDQVIERLDKKETEGYAVETSDGKETEGRGSKSSDGKETQDYHVEKGGFNSTQQIQTNIEDIIAEGYKGPNGGIAKEETDVDIPAVNSHQSEEVEASEVTGGSNIENMTRTLILDNTENITSVGSVTFEDQLSKPSIEEDSSHAISSTMTKKELYVPSASENILANVEVIESRVIEEEIINNEKIGHDAPVNDALKSDNLGSPLSAPPVTPIEETCFTSSGSEADVASFDTKGITSLDEQNETEEKTRDTKINLPDVHTESRKDETNDASSSQDNQPFDDKSISADGHKEEDGTNKYDTAKGQPDAPSLIHETEVCEQKQISGEESEEMHKINEANTMPHSSNLGLSPIEGASDMDVIPHCQIDAEKDEHEIDSPQELHISTESIAKDKLQQNDADIETIKEETRFHSSSAMPTARITDELDIQENENREDCQMELLSEAKEELGDGKEEDMNDTNQNLELQGHGESDISNKEDEEISNITDKEHIIQVYPEKLTTEELKKTNEEAASECKNTKVNSPNKEEGTKDELAASVKERDFIDSMATPEEVIKASIEEDKGNGSQVKEEPCDQVIKSTKFSADEVKLEKSYGEDDGKEEIVVISQTSTTDDSCKQISSISDPDLIEHVDTTHLEEQASCEELPTISSTVMEEHSSSSNLETHVTNGSFKRMEDQGIKSDERQIDETPCENVEVMHKNFSNESSQVPEHIEKNYLIILTPEDIEEEGTLNELRTVSEEHIPSHEVKDIGLASLQSIDTIDSNDKAEEIPVLLAENFKTEEDPSIIEAPEEMKEGKEQVEGTKNTSLKNVEKKDPEEKSEGRDLQLEENSNTEQDSPTTEVAQETTGDKEHVQDMSSMSLQNIDRMDLDEKSEERVLQLAENSNTEQESSTTEVPKETTGDETHIQDMTNMIFENSEEASSHNLMKEADVLVKKESSLEDVHNDEETFHVYSTDMDDKDPLRINSSCETVEEVEIQQLERTSGSVYQTEPSETKEIISERLDVETTKEQEDNKDEGQQNLEGIEEISGIIHGNNNDDEDRHMTSSQKKPEATNELQETCGVQHREEQEPEALDSIKETIHEGEIAVGVGSTASSEEKCLLKNHSDAPELRKAFVEVMRDQSRLEEENIYKENSEDTGAEMSSPDPNCLASESSTKDVDNYSMSNVTVIIEEFQESKEATDSKSDIVHESEAKLRHAEVPGETVKGGIKEGALPSEIGADNILKEEMTETGSLEDNISREKVKEEGSNDLEREAIPEEPQIITIEEMSKTTKKENNDEKVSTCDIDIIQSGKDKGDDEYEKSTTIDSESEKRTTTGDFPETDTPGSNEVGENSELLAEGHKSAEGTSIETSEEIRRNIVHEETNENNEGRVIFAANTSDIKVNEVAEQHGITEGDHSKIQDPSLEKLKEDYIDTKEVQILDKPLPPLPEVSIANIPKDIEMMPESLKTTAQAVTQKQQTTYDSNVVPEATNLDSELQCTSDESKTIEQKSTTIRPVNESTLDLTQGPKDNNLSDADEEESLTQLSEVHGDQVIKDVAEKEDALENEIRNNKKIEIKNTSNLPVSSDKDSEERDPLESKPMISSKDKDIPLLESGSTMVTVLEEVKQVYPCEAVPEPDSIKNAEKIDSHDHKETPDSTRSDHGQGFAEENVHEPGDADKQDQHEDSHVIQNVQESSMISQEGSIDVVESTHQTAELPLASLSTSESLLTPEVGQLIVSSPKDCKDVSEMQEEIAAEGNRVTDEPVETTEKLLPSEISEESTLEQADHPGETNKLNTQPAGGEAKPDHPKVEKEEHGKQKEGSSGSKVVFIGENVPDEKSKVEKDEHGAHKEGNSGSEVAFIGKKDPDEEAKVGKEEDGEQKEGSSRSEIVFIGEKDLDEDVKVDKDEHVAHKEGNSGFEVAFIGEKDPDKEAKVEKEEDGEQKEGSLGSEVAFIGTKDLDEDAKVEKEEHGEHKEGNSGSEVAFVGEKDPDDKAKVEKEEHGKHKEGNSGSEVVFIGEKDPDEEAKVDKDEKGEHKEGNSGSEVAFIGKRDLDEEAKVEKEEDGEQKEGVSGSEVAFIGKKDHDEDAKVEKDEHGEHKEGNSGSKVSFVGEKDLAEEAKVEKEEHSEQKEGNSGSEVVFIDKKDADDNTDKIIAAEVKEKDTSSTIVSNDIILVQVDQEGTETFINKEGSRVKADEAMDEEKEQDVQRENKSGSDEPIKDEKHSAYETSNKIVAGEMDNRSNMAMSERILSGDSEDHMEAVIFSKDKEVKTDQIKVEREEQDVWKGKEPVSEALPVSEKDVDRHTIDLSIVGEMKDGTSSETQDDITLVQECPEDHREKKNYSEDKEANADQCKTVEDQDVPKESNPEAEVPLTGEKDNDHHTSNIIPIIEMKDKSLIEGPDYRTLVQEYPGAGTEEVLFNGDKEVKAGSAEVATGDQDGLKEEKLDSEVADTSEKDRVDNMVSVKENSDDFKATMIRREDKGIKPDWKSGVTDAEIEKPIQLNTSEVVAEKEKCESTEERISSDDYQEMQEVMESTLSPKSSQTNQRQDSAEETKLNTAKIESPIPDNLHALPHITDLPTETIKKADDSDIHISSMNKEKIEIPPLEAEKYMVVEADLKVSQEPENAKNILQQKESAETFQADEKSSGLGEQGSIPANNNNEKTTSNETNKAAVEHFSNKHLSEATTEDSKAVKSTEHKDKEYEEGKEHQDNTSSDLRVMIEPSRDVEVKVSPKKSHNLLSGVIKHSISKMKKAITCTNSQPMPQSPR